MKVHYRKQLNSNENQCELDKSNLNISFKREIFFTVLLHYTLSNLNYLYQLDMLYFKFKYINH